MISMPDILLLMTARLQESEVSTNFQGSVLIQFPRDKLLSNYSYFHMAEIISRGD